jgi:hypothetical protein
MAALRLEPRVLGISYFSAREQGKWDSISIELNSQLLELRDDSQFDGWVICLARHAPLNQGRRRRRERQDQIHAGDYNLWRMHFRPTTPGSGLSASANVAVPEPAAFVLLLFVAVGLCLRRPWAT